MTTVRKMKDAKKAALQDELKYYSGLLAAHYSSKTTQPQHPNVQSVKNNPAHSSYSAFKTTANHMHHYKSNSLQPKNVNQLPNQNLKAMPDSTLHNKIISTNKASHLFNLRRYPCKSSMVKVNPSSISNKSLNHVEKNIEHNLLKKNHLDSKKQMNPGILNNPSGSSSKVLIEEISLLIKQLKQKTGNITNKDCHVSLKSHLMNKSILNKQELKTTVKVPTDSEVFCKVSTNSQAIDLKDKNYNILSSIGSLSSKPNSCLFDGKNKISQGKLPDCVDSLVKPLIELENDYLYQSSHKSKAVNELSQNLSAKLENGDVLQLNNTIKTPIKKKLIRKRLSSVKKSSVTLFASKYKVVNRKFPCAQKEKLTVVTAEVKNPLKMKPAKKHINSVKKIKSRSRLITTKYKIINKKSPCVQSLKSENPFLQKGDKMCKLPINNKWTSLKTNKIKLNANKLSSKYKIVNKSEKSVNVLESSFIKKSIKAKESVKYQENKNLNKFNPSNSLRKYTYTRSKLDGEIKTCKSMTLLKQNNLNLLNLKNKRHTPSRNSFILNSKYRTVNKKPNGSIKKITKPVKSSNLSSKYNSSIDLDLLMELAAEKKECNDNLVTNPPSKHVLIKRVYKSKNTIVNKNICSLQSKAAKMIKTKYSILNKKHSWPKGSFTKSPKYFKGHEFNHTHQRKKSFFHSQRNKRFISRHKAQHHVSTHFMKRSYSRNYLVSTNRSNAIGSFQSTVKTPKRFVLNRKVYLKTPNSLKSNVPASKTMASRALNRSINRVLTASVKKKTSKVNIYCMFYNRFGRCNKGIKCPYVHDPSKIAVCTRFLRGTCKTENCPFSHEICPGKMAICSFFLLGSCTKTDCPYRHETLSPNAKLCKAFVQGYCPDGKQCKQAHVLVCPQFVQGHCDKGDVCPFPHPPSKEKKPIPDLAEKSVNEEETEELILEKMSRYFECANESVTNNKLDMNSIAVPRVRNLPEQPSFIAL